MERTSGSSDEHLTESEARLSRFFVEHRSWLSDLWTVYDTHYERLAERSLQLLKVPVEQINERNKLARKLLHRAFVDGDWMPYVASLRSRGAVFARAHISFADFHELLCTHRREIVPVVFEAFRSDPARVARAVTVIAELVDLVTGVITENYLAERERGGTEASLQAVNRFLDSIVENIPNMIFVKEAGELRFVRFNRAGEELVGVKRSELLGKSDLDLFPAEQAAHFQARDRETLASKLVLDIPEEPLQTARGQRWLHTKKVPLLDEHGEPKFLLGISEDISEWKRVSEELRRAKETAELASRELEAFSYSVAHDLRAPLRGINGYAVALIEDLGDKLDPEPREYLARISEGATRMGALIDALLGLSRVSRAELAREQVNLSELARIAIDELRAAEPERSVDFVCAEPLVALGDPQLLRALLQNLLGNAWKFTARQEAARIELGREEHQGAAAYFVRDNGAGFDMQYAAKLFAPFHRLHNANDFAGTGIGLATVQRIVRRHGGRIWAQGAVERGASFHFTLDEHGAST